MSSHRDPIPGLATQRCAAVGATPGTIPARIRELPKGLRAVARAYFGGVPVEDTVDHRNKLARVVDFLSFGPTWFLHARADLVRRVEARRRV